jgi:hypothetical protein
MLMAKNQRQPPFPSAGRGKRNQAGRSGPAKLRRSLRRGRDRLAEQTSPLSGFYRQRNPGRRSGHEPLPYSAIDGGYR